MKDIFISIQFVRYENGILFNDRKCHSVKIRFQFLQIENFTCHNRNLIGQTVTERYYASQHVKLLFVFRKMQTSTCAFKLNQQLNCHGDV